jgi:signal transduction histidine kinase
MKPRTASRLAWSMWATTLLLQIASFLLRREEEFPAQEIVFAVIFPLFLLAFSSVGALIASRQPGNPIGWIFLGVGLLWALAGTSEDFAWYSARTGAEISSLVRTADWLGAWLFLPGLYVPVTFLFLLFPDGRLPSRRWLPVAWVSIAGIALISATSSLKPGPLEELDVLRTNPYALGPPALWDVVEPVAWFAGIAGMVGSVAALVVRLRRSSGALRQQMKWLAYAGILVALLFIGVGVGWGVAGDNETMTSFVLPLITFAALFMIPVATGIAILRHRLYDIDVVINKTVVYGALAAFITAAYLALVIGIGAVVGGRTILSIIATALIAVAFQPIRQRVQVFANRLVYGQRVTPYEAMAELSHQMAGAISLDEVLPRMARTAAEGMGAARSRVRVFLPDGEERVAWWPPEVGADSFDRRVPVSYRQEEIGEIAVAKAPGDSLTPAEEKLFSDLASQAGLALRNVRLTEDLRASRRRIVTAQDEERRRMERDIHDGAQQQLVSMSVKLGLLKSMMVKDPDRASALAEEIKAEAGEAVETLRDLARGLFPPVLVDQGLEAALRAHIDKLGLRASLQEGLKGSRFDQSAEAAVYFCIREALQNASKHASESPITIRLAADGGSFEFSVTDEGPGFDATAMGRGSGLQNMVDRLEALGGTLEVRSAPGRGTTIEGRIPVRVAEPVA